MAFDARPRIDFGKHKDKLLEDVPASYLLWIYENDVRLENKVLHEYIAKNLKAIKKRVADDRAENCEDWWDECSDCLPPGMF